MSLFRGNRVLVLLVGPALFHMAGCAPPAREAYAPSAQVVALSAENQESVKKVLTEFCGSVERPKMLGQPDMNANHLKRGESVYKQYCQQCHGVTGDGNGPQAAYMIPKPRDYRKGMFKFTSTVYGSKPLREDILRTIRRGIMGSSMPKFNLLARRDLEAVTDYVLALTHRGELESLLADAAEFDGKIDPAAVPGMVQGILDQWKEARTNVVNPRAPMPTLTEANVKAGKEMFLSIGCNKCHGDEGRGEVTDALPNDSWGNPNKAADITAGMLRGGTDPLDVYRRIEAGINGTSMPAFRSQFETNAEKIWDLVAYVLSVYDSRRNGIIAPSIIMKPLPGVGAEGAGSWMPAQAGASE